MSAQRDLMSSAHEHMVSQNTFAPVPKPPWLLNPDIPIWGIRELKRFWEGSEGKAGNKSMWGATQELVQGLHYPFGLVLRYLHGHLTVGWMAQGFSGMKESLESAFPSVCLEQYSKGGPDLLRSMPAFSSALIVSGNPSTPLQNTMHQYEQDPLSLDTLIQGLVNFNWIYLSIAIPLSQERRRDELHRVYAQEKELRARYLRPGTALEKSNPRAETALKEVQAAKSRLEEGLRTGLWQTVTLLYLDRREGISPGISLLRSLFSGQEAQPGSLKLQVCLADAPTSATGGALPYTVLNARDVARFMHLPVYEYQGYPVRPLTEFDRHITKASPGKAISLGALTSAPFSPISVKLSDLSKHMLIAGTTGSGKTNTCLSILNQAWKMHSIPFLVLETSEKSEYGHLLHKYMAKDLTVFTLGNESKNPLHLDILHVPAGKHIEAHIGHLMRIFKAALPLPPPTPYILEEALRIWYSRSGWNLEQGDKSTSRPPLVFQDLIDIIKDLLHTKYAHYDPQTRGNIETALLVRLESFTRGGIGRFLAGDALHERSWEVLLRRPMVMELSTFTDPDTKALAVLFILYRLMSSAHQLFAHDPGRMHLTVVEEAHRVLKDRQPSQHPDVADTQSAMVDEFANALSEVRYAGEGLIILDQMPGKLSPAVRANTNMKMAHRLPEEEQQRCLSQAAGLSAEQQRILFRLPPGEGLWFPADGGVHHMQVPLFGG